MVTLVFARILLEASANACAAPANFEGRTALGGAAEHGRLDVLQLLLNTGCLP
jgi:ankyrin repeat protein